jgi:hypothetical protein
VAQFLDALDAPLPPELLRDLSFLQLLPETLAQGCSQWRAPAPPPTVTLRQAVRITPGNEDAIFNALALRQAATSAVEAAGGGSEGGGEVSVLLFLYGALRHWRRAQSAPQQADVGAAASAPPSSRLMGKAEAMRRRDMAASTAPGAAAAPGLWLPPLAAAAAEKCSSAMGAGSSSEPAWAFSFPKPRAAAAAALQPAAQLFPPLVHGLRAAAAAPPPWTSGTNSLESLVRRAHWQAAHLTLGRSRIDGMGLFATIPIEPEDVLIEYTGEVVGDAVCDAREAYYRRLGIADYMFRMGTDEVVDATLRGSRARYINHSCDPNCYAVIHTLPEQSAAAAAADRKSTRLNSSHVVFTV